MSLRIERLCKDIGELVVQTYVREGNIAILNMVAYHMNSDVDAFGLRMETWVISKGDCAHVAVMRYLLGLIT